MAKQRIPYLKVDRLDVQNTLVAGTTLIDLANAATDEKAKVSSNDTTPGFLNGKLVAGANVTLTENNNGGNETLTISANFTDADDKVKVSAGDTTPAFLDTKIVAGSNITLTKGNAGGNETYTVAATVPVTSVNTKTGAVTLTNTDVGAAATSHTHAASDVTSGVLATARLASTGTASSSTFLRGDQTWATAPVTSVNTQTGAVTLTAASVGAAATSHTHAASDVTSGVFATARLASSGTASASTYLRGDQTWATIAAGGGLTGTSYVYVAGDGTPTQNGTALVNAYNAAIAKTPSASNVITVLVAPGVYDTTTTFTMNTQYINVVSLDGNRSVIMSQNVLITANNVFVGGLIAGEINIGSNLSALTVRNCSANNGFGYIDNSASATTLVVSGTFIDCSVGGNGFGATSNITPSVVHSITVSGTFIRCTATRGFGYVIGTSGTPVVVVTGVFTDCTASNRSFGHLNNNNFTRTGSSCTGTFDRCSSGVQSFGGGVLGFAGTAINCLASSGSGGSDSSFIGGWPGGSQLTGRLFYCRLSAGTFPTVSSPGRVYYSVDGNGAVNNQ